MRKANLRVQRALDEMAISLVFDRSVSMASGKKETVAQQTAAIFFKAYLALPMHKSIFWDLMLCL
jgi:hypothetical protein